MFLAIHTLLQDCEHVLTVLVAVATLPPNAVAGVLESFRTDWFCLYELGQLAECRTCILKNCKSLVLEGSLSDAKCLN